MRNRKERDGIPGVCVDMENKVVCYYCGTIYDEERGKCPLCGSTARSTDSAQPVRRQRQTDEERKTSRSAPRGNYAASASKEKNKQQPAPKGMLVAAVVFLALAVLVVFYFIGDMIGWWPGLENLVERDVPSISEADTACLELTLTPETLEFSAVGETKELTVRVNLSCGEKVYCYSENSQIAVISEEASTAMGEETKSATFTVEAIAEGETQIVVQCGDKSASCKVVCGAEGSSQPGGSSISGDEFTPELNYASEVALYQKGETATLRVTNLPDGAEVLWRSANESVASIDASGTVTAVGSGTTTVTAEVNGKTAEVQIRCSFGSGTGSGAHLQAGREDVSVSVGESFDLYLYDSNGNHIDDITYTVENSSICEVKNNYVTALARGTTRVIVTYNGQEFVCVVRVG